METGYGYKYKNILPVGMLGLVDDTVAITEVGYKAQMMNAFFNIKTVTVWNQKMQKYVDWEKYQDCDQQ